MSESRCENMQGDKSNNSISSAGLSVGYKKNVIVSGIEFNIKPGEIVSIIGPNGAGKSTILKTIIREIKSLKGVVNIGDVDIKNLNNAEFARKLSIVMTERINVELMSVYEVVSMGRYPYTDGLGRLKTTDKEIIDKVAKTVQIEELLDKDFMTLSDGQKQRVILAMALCKEPEILIMDEPTSFLDIKFRIELVDILRKLSRERKLTIITSMHEIDIAMKFSDTIIAVKNGKIDRIGSVDEVFTQGYIETLYDMEKGSYNRMLGSIEFEKVKGEPEVFVIAGNGTGIDTFRMLAKNGISFATGILYENDIDYVVAKSLTDNIIVEKAFCKISDDNFIKAFDTMKKCSKVICTVNSFGDYANENLKLVEEAKKLKKM